MNSSIYRDPVHFHLKDELAHCDLDLATDETGWYFWDESWASRHGPFSSRSAAVAMLHEYSVNQLGVSHKE